MLEEELTSGRFSVELAALVAGTIKRDIGFAVIGHKATEKGRQQ